VIARLVNANAFLVMKVLHANVPFALTIAMTVVLARLKSI